MAAPARAPAPPAVTGARAATAVADPGIAPPRPRPGSAIEMAGMEGPVDAGGERDGAANGTRQAAGLPEPAAGHDGEVGRRAEEGSPITVVEAPVLRPPASPHRRVIALDPGHGASIPAPSHRRQPSRRPSPSMSPTRLKRMIEASGRYEVVMTRDADVFVSLRDRMETARQAEASLFISLHADSLGDARFRGASVYTSPIRPGRRGGPPRHQGEPRRRHRRHRPLGA
jgi:N-acetylmuramoyl-L-alanine amidase